MNKAKKPKSTLRGAAARSAAGEKLGGRPKGTPNKMTASLREMILGALDKAGGEDYLHRQAENNPGAFLTLVGKVLPHQIQAEMTGKDGGAIQQKMVVEFIRPNDSSEKGQK